MSDERHHKVTCDFGMPDYLRHYKKTTEDPVDDKVFRSVLKSYLMGMNKLVSTEGYSFRLPERTGTIEVRKAKREPRLDDNGVLINHMPINWKATNELWEEDEIARKKKIKIYYTNEHTDGYVFDIIYIKKNATFKNKGVYRMQVNRQMKRDTFKPIMEGKLDAFLKYEE